MQVIKKILLSFIILSSSMHYSFASDLNKSKVVVLVNNIPITRADIDREVNRLLPQEFYHRNITPEKQKEIEKKAIENLVNSKLFIMEAKRLGIKVDNAEVKKRIDDAKASYKNKKAFEDALKKIDLTPSSLEEKVKDDILIEKLINQQVKVNLTDAELSEYYTKNIEKFKEPESVRLKHIYVKINPSQKDATKIAYERAREAFSKITAGEDFAYIAQQYSNDMSRVKGGEVGFIHKGMMPQEIEKVAFALSPGQVSDIIKTDTGFHIIKVEEKRAKRLVQFNDIKEKLKKELSESLQKEKMQNLVNRLRQKVEIQYVK